MSVETDVDTLLIEAGWKPSVDRKGGSLPFARREGGYWVVNGRPNGVDDHVGVAGPGAEFSDPVELTRALIERAAGARQRLAESIVAAPVAPPPEPEETCAPPVVEPDPDIFDDPVPDERDDEIDALRDEIAELRAQLEAERGAHRFPASLGERVVPPDIAPMMLKDETLAEAVERMTPGMDELLDLASVLGDGSLEEALRTIPPDRVSDWTGRLNDEKGRIRLLRGTVEENIERENLINRVMNTFARVGAKR